MSGVWHVERELLARSEDLITLGASMHNLITALRINRPITTRAMIAKEK